MKNIARHEAKIEQELNKAQPDMLLIRKWEGDIDIARRVVRQLEERLAK